MPITGLWVSRFGYKVTETETGRTTVVSIAGTADEMGDPEFMLDMASYARESCERDWKEQDRSPKKTMDSPRRHDLGAILMDIKASNERKRETLHATRWY